MPGLAGSFPLELLQALQGGMQSPYQTGLAETMQAPQGQDAYDVYEKLFAMFAPEFSSPSEDWRKQAMANAIGMAGSAMLGGDTFSQGQAAAFPAFHQSMYGQEQDEQRRLDLRSREDALSRYRAASAAGVGQEREQQPGLTELQRWAVEQGVPLGDDTLIRQAWNTAHTPEEGWQPKSPEQIAQELEIYEEKAKIGSRYEGSPTDPPKPPSPNQEEQIFQNYFERYLATPENLEKIKGVAGFAPESAIQFLVMEDLRGKFGRPFTMEEALEYMRTGNLPEMSLEDLPPAQ